MRSNTTLVESFVLVLVLGAAWGCGGKKPDPFTAEVIREYASLADLGEGTQPQSGHVVGKAVLINVGETISLHRFSAREQNHDIPSNTLSKAHGKINREIQASAPVEVDTVILLKWSKEALGETMAGTKYRLLCDVIIVDKSQRRVVARKPFTGDEPEFATLYGASPEDQIVQYINALPRQASHRGAR